MTRVVIVGAAGRMGQTLCHLAQTTETFELAGAIELDDDLDAAISQSDAVIEFAHHSTSLATAKAASTHQKPLVLGTTGHTPEEMKQLESFAAQIPLVIAPNFSIGVNTLFWLTRQAARILGPSYHQEIVEIHHAMKIDAPSGTAKRLGAILAEAQDGHYDDLICHGRQGEPGQRPSQEIGMHALRGGDVVGEHTVYFAGTGERIELTHRASSRETFANGALRAAQWATHQKPNLYSMEDVLGLSQL